MEEIKPGDVVVLKSGGVPMTVEAIDESSYGQPFAVCSWFDKTVYTTKNIHIAGLKKHEESDIPPLVF